MSNTGWAIKSDLGFYAGWCFTKAEAIAEHVAKYDNVSNMVVSGGLDDEQRKSWKERRSFGDRAVRIEIREI